MKEELAQGRVSSRNISFRGNDLAQLGKRGLLRERELHSPQGDIEKLRS
jgi:hypothetical protein